LSTASADLNLLAPDCPVEKSRLKINEHRTEAELGIVKSVSDANPAIGDTITFTLSVNNNAIFPAINFLVTDKVPAGFGGISNISHGGTLTGSTVQWIIPTLAVGGNIVLTFDVVVQ